ncbi:MAG: YeiH family protein [Prevotellaceae bacterium]|nr:YeiH family protein [Prevotellaceae bacterium]
MNKKLKLSEDWSSTIMGGFIILLVILVYSIKQGMPWPSFSWTNTDELADRVFALDNLGHTLIVCAFSFAMVVISNLLSGKKLRNSLGYFVLFALTFIGMTIAGNKLMKDWGIETVIFNLLIGLFISNVFGVPDWVKRALSSEMYVKIGLVLLGTTVVFDKLIQLGTIGILQSVIVVFGVWYFSFWFCKKMKIDEEMSMMLSSAVSICGVSAAVATAGAIKGDKTKLSYVVSLVLIVAVPMIFLMPSLAKLVGLNAVMAGAWIGGTVDTTGAVVATGAVYGGEATDVSVIIKSSQNVLLGIAAFIISIYWSYKQNKGRSLAKTKYADKPSLKLVWERFPKFVLGFLGASLLFSFLINPVDNKPAMDTLKKMQGLWFALAFTSIGLETNFKSFINVNNRRATVAFLIAQIFNILFTLLVIYLLAALIGY